MPWGWDSWSDFDPLSAANQYFTQVPWDARDIRTGHDAGMVTP